MIGKHAERRLLLVRHASTAWNRAGLVMGQTDVPLDLQGTAEAEVAARDLHIAGVDALFSSPLVRCIRTAEAFERVLDLRMQVMPELEERAWGSFEGRPKAERDEAAIGSGIEEFARFRTRVLHALERIEGQAILPLIVTHSGVIQAVLHESEQSPIDRIPHLTPIVVPGLRASGSSSTAIHDSSCQGGATSDASDGGRIA